MTQGEALTILKMGHNVFLTGQAGSGKTFLLNKYIEYLKEHSVGVAVTASTGVAATHMDGMTIHSWTGIGIKDNMSDDELRDLFRKKHVNERFRKTNVLIIDEVSMLHSYRLDLVERAARMMKGNFEPFGGMQVILCGDFFQLPPVSRGEIASNYFAFKSSVWGLMKIRVCYLDSQFRQSDPVFLSVLNAIRSNAVNQEIINILKMRFQAAVEGREITRLYTHNEDVDAINNWELGKLPAEPQHFKMQAKGIKLLVDELRKNCLAPEELVLKDGAVVMFVKNNFERGYVNGTLGFVVGFEESGYPLIRTKKGVEIIASPESWVIEESGTIKAEISQIPLRLAWAITVHKSQGMSLDAAEIDLSKAFEAGMGYVALSRVRSLDGLRLMGLNETALRVNQEVLEFDRVLLANSKEEAETISRLSVSALKELQDEFIKRVKPQSEEKAYSVADIREVHAKAYEKWTEEDDSELAEGYKSGKKIKELANVFGRNAGAIRSRLKKLGLVENH